MKGLIPGLIGLAALVTTASANMYDGSRPPTQFHLDQRLTISDQTAYKPIFKYFGDDLFAAVAFPTVDGEMQAIGGGLGIIIDELLGQYTKAMAVLNYGIPKEGPDLSLEPTLYATIEWGRLTADPRAWYDVSVDDSEFTENGYGLGLTLGIGLTDRFRVGADIEKTIDDEIEVKGIVSMVLEPKKQVLEAYIGEDQVGFRYVFNIGE